MFWINDKFFDRWKIWFIFVEWIFWEWLVVEVDKGNVIYLYKVILYICIVYIGDF